MKRRVNRTIIKKTEIIPPHITTPEVIPVPEESHVDSNKELDDALDRLKDHKGFVDFKNAIGMRESSNDYTVENKYGYLGRYQFGLARLSDFGLCSRRVGTRGYGNKSFVWKSPFSESVFLNSPSLQDMVFSSHVRNYKLIINRRYGMWVNKDIYGVRVTVSGIIACFHLLGMGGFNDFLSGKDGSDANGTKATDYIKLFAGYSIPDDLPKHTVRDYVHLIRNQEVA